LPFGGAVLSCGLDSVEAEQCDDHQRSFPDPRRSLAGGGGVAVETSRRNHLNISTNSKCRAQPSAAGPPASAGSFGADAWAVRATRPTAWTG